MLLKERSLDHSVIDWSRWPQKRQAAPERDKITGRSGAKYRGDHHGEEFMRPMRNVFLQWLAVLALLVLPGGAGFAQSKAPATPEVALKGHDTVAYFTEKRPVMGTAQNGYEWDGSRYQFSSVKNRELFAANPDRYAPQFSGLCATGLSMGMKTAADPNVWKIVDGKLYVFSSVEAMQMVEKDPSILARAHQSLKKKN